jgi:fatty-acid desaturase
MSLSIVTPEPVAPQQAPALSRNELLFEALRTQKWRFDFVNVPFIAVFHVLSIVALFFFSWTNFFVALGFYVLTALGITVGYHRLLTHRSFKSPRWVEVLWTIAGVLALQGGPVTWVALHRLHHKESDRQHDPHDIKKGFFHAHMGWLLKRPQRALEAEICDIYAPDLKKDKFFMWFEDYQIVPTLVLGAILFAFGGWSMVLWGVMLRTTALYHGTWFVNSAAHVWGGRPFKDSEGTNNWWVAILAMGEGWHNNHHAFPSSARHGLRGWQIDPSWIVIKSMSWIGLAKNIKLISPHSLARAQATGSAASTQA